MNPPPGRVRGFPPDRETALLCQQTRDMIIQDYRNLPKDAAAWKPTTAKMFGYEISLHGTKEQARAAHLEKNPGSESWHIGIPATLDDYLQLGLKAPLAEGSLRRAKQSLFEQDSQVSKSGSHPKQRQSEARTKVEAPKDHWGNDTVLDGGGLTSVWGEQPEQPEIREPSRVLSFKSLHTEFEDGWKD